MAGFPNEFDAVSIVNNHVFSWVFMVDWIMALALTVFMVLYFNRFIGWVVSVGVKWWLWRTHRAQLEVQSLQVSLLGGRLFFKNLSYVGSNEAICALQGHITWRYWLLRPRLSKFVAPHSPELTSESSSAKIVVHVTGLEWFVFNRTASYDDLLAAFTKASGAPDAKDAEKSHNLGGDAGNLYNNLAGSDSSHTASPHLGPTITNPSSQGNAKLQLPTSQSSATNAGSHGKQSVDSAAEPTDSNDALGPMLLKFLPVELHCTKGALVIGNRLTPCLNVLHFVSGVIAVDVEQPACSLDLYKVAYRIRMTNLIFEMRANIGYHGPEASGFSPVTPFSVARTVVGSAKKFVLARLKTFKPPDTDVHDEWDGRGLHPQSTFQQVPSKQEVKKTASASPVGTGAVDESLDGPQLSPSNWKGLPRYNLHYEADVAEEKESFEFPKDQIVEEYAKYSTLIDASEATITYYYDIPGKVMISAGPDDPAPEWGVQFAFQEATIHYGPWADKQRLKIQQMLFPKAFFDTSPTPRPRPGSRREYSHFSMFIEFGTDVIIRVPFREQSKAAGFMTNIRKNPNALQLSRPFGWLELKARKESTIDYQLPMISSAVGWKNEIRIDFRDFEVRSSVNHGLVLRADSHLINGIMDIPHKWNGLQTWNFGMTSKNLKTFFLREHVTLLIDLVGDFSSGPPVPYNQFVPTLYKLDWTVRDYGIFLNVNDKNIINNPSDFADNTFLSFQGQDLNIRVDIPMEQVKAIKNKLDFAIETPRFDLVLDAPEWHTFHNFVENKGLGRAYGVKVDGVYTYFSGISDVNTDTLEIVVHGSDTTFVTYGFALNYIIKVRENYFGDDSKFRTLEEYTSSPVDAPPDFTHLRLDNDLDVLIHAYVDNVSLVVPLMIYGADTNFNFEFSSFDMDCRFTNYYMDLQVNLTPLKGYYNSHMESEQVFELAHDTGSNNRESNVFIDGVTIHGNRMFGLPPTEPTYFCKWDFDVGDVIAHGPLQIAEAYQKIGPILVYSYDDAENKLLLPEPELFDVTYVSAKIASIKSQFYTENSMLQVDTDTIDFSFRDLANFRYSARVTVEIPSIHVAILSRTKSTDGKHHVKAAFRTSVVLNTFEQKRDMDVCRVKQQEHIALHDSPFHRCPFLLDDEHRHSPDYMDGRRHGPVPSIPLSTVPPPLTRDNLRMIDPNMKELAVATHGDDTANTSSVGSSASQFGSSQASSRSSFSDDWSMSHGGSRLSRRAKASVRKMASASAVSDETELVVLESEFLPPFEWLPLGHEEGANVSNSFNLQPTINYSENDVKGPSRELDPAVKYISLIVQFGAIEGEVSPLALSAINEIIESSGNDDLDQTMDTLQIDFVSKLRIRHESMTRPQIMNIRLVVPSLSLKYGNLPTGVGCIQTALEQGDTHIYLDFRELNFVVRLSEKRLEMDQVLQAEEVPVHRTVYLNLMNASIGVRRGRRLSNAGEEPTVESTHGDTYDHRDGYSPMVLSIDHTEFWWHEESQSVGSVRIRTIDSFVSSDHVSWVTEFLESNINDLKRITASSNDKPRRSYHSRAAYMLYNLALAGERFEIKRDPSVLTRRAYVIQSPEHIRASVSWKIIMRLRHILRSTPLEWQVDHTRELVSNTYSIPPDAQQRTVSIFNRWRNWEFTNISNSYVFGYVFTERSLKERIISLTTSTSLDIESIALRLQHADSEDYLCFDYLKVLFDWSSKVSATGTEDISVSPTEQPSENRVLSADVSIGCQNIRSRYSHELLDIFSTVQDVLSREVSSLPVPEPKAGDGGLEEEEDGHAESHLSLNFRLILIVEQLQAIAIVPSLEAKIDLSGLKLTAAYEQLDPTDKSNMDATAAVNSDSIDFVLIARESGDESNEKLLQITSESPVLGLSSCGPVLTSSKYITAHPKSLTIELCTDGIRIANIFERMIDVDLPLLQAFAEKMAGNEAPLTNVISDVRDAGSFERSSEPDSAVNPSKVSGTDFPVYVHIRSDDLSLRFALLPSLSCLYEAHGAEVKLHYSGPNVQSGSFALSKQTFDVLMRTAHEQPPFVAASIQSKNLHGVSKLELQVSACRTLDFMASMESLKVDVGTVSDLLTVAKEKQAERDIVDMMGRIYEIRGLINTKLLKNDDLPPTVSKGSASSPALPLIKANVSVGSSTIAVPMYGIVPMIQTEGLILRFGQFLRYEDGLVSKTPVVAGASVDSLMLGVKRTGHRMAEQQFTVLKMQVAGLFEQSMHSADRFSLSSDVTRVMMSPVTVQMLFEVGVSLSDELTRFEILKSQPSESSASRDVHLDSIDKLARQLTATMLFKDVAAAWMFDAKAGDLMLSSPILLGHGGHYGMNFPGMLFGYETLEIQAESGTANLDLKGVYTAPAVPHDTFLSTTCTPDTANSATLPNVRLFVDYTKKEEIVSVKLTGESLHLSLLSSSVVLFGRFGKSISSTKSLIEDLMKSSESLSKSVHHHPPRPVKPIRLSLSWRLDVKFDGAVIDLWDHVEFNRRLKQLEKSATRPREGSDPDPQDDAPKDKGDDVPGDGESGVDVASPAMSLHTPALMAALQYTSSKSSKRDSFSMEILITPTSNTIYSRVMPVVVSMTRLVKEMVREVQQSKTTPKMAAESPLSRRASTMARRGSTAPSADEMELLFSAIDANIVVRFASQELTLSCLPVARVAATVSTHRCFIGINTCDDKAVGNFLSASVKIDRFRASLQHIYSREVSGFVSVEEVMVLATKGRRSKTLEPVRLAGKVAGIEFDVNMKQMQDLEVFQDIWLPSTLSYGHEENDQNAEAGEPNEAVESQPEEGIMRKYQRAATTVAIPWTVNFAVLDIAGHVDMGQAVGKFHCSMGHLWVSLRKYTDWEQHLSAGIDEIAIRSHGRLGVNAEMEKLHIRSSIMWEPELESFNVPLVQAVAGFDAFDAQVYLDYHTFAMVRVDEVNFAMSNQKDHDNILGDRLLAAGDCKSISILLTSLAASNFLEIAHTFSRMRTASHASYEAILQDSVEDQQGNKRDNVWDLHNKKRIDVTLDKLFTKLRTMFDLQIQALSLFVFPNSFVDTVVFTTSFNQAHARFIQEQRSGVLESNLRLSMDGILVALSTLKRTFTQEVAQTSTSEFLSFLSESVRGGTILRVPVIHVAMKSWQEFEQSVVEYTFNNSIGGRVDISWNLGSVNFIREMFENHARAFASRKAAYSSKAFEPSAPVTTSLSEENLDKNLKEIELNWAYTYVAREPPDFATPQLRQLGEATPPIEWIGIHRQKLPGLTHQFVIVGLQTLVHRIEQLYGQALGHS